VGHINSITRASPKAKKTKLNYFIYFVRGKTKISSIPESNKKLSKRMSYGFFNFGLAALKILQTL